MRFLRACAAACALLAVAASAAPATDLLTLINAYRAAPAQCGGRSLPAVPALRPSTALAQLSLAPGRFLQQDLARAGYRAAQVEAIGVHGSGDTTGVMQLLVQQHCASLRAREFTDIGVRQTGQDWSIILAREDIVPALPSQADGVLTVLAASNRARASARNCGSQHFAAAPPLVASPALSQAALVHSSEMAALRYFSHQGKDGSQVSERATRAGFNWQQIGENIASGMHTPEEAVAGWVASPGHCANLMNPAFTEMGSGFAQSADSEIVFWTQVFGRRR